MKSILSSHVAKAKTLNLNILVLTIFSIALPCAGSSRLPSLTFTPAVTHIPLKQGTTTTDIFTITSGGSFSGNVVLSVSGLPSSIAYSWSQNPVTPNNGTGYSTLRLTTGATVPPNWYAFTVTATGSGLAVSRMYTVEVEPSAGVQTQLSHNALSLASGSKAFLAVTAILINGITVPAGALGATAVIVSPLPGGITSFWSQPSVTSTGAVNWTLVLTANSTAESGRIPLALSVAITDKNSGLVYTTSPSVTLLVSLLADVNIGTAPGVAIPPTFMGLSHEWGNAQSFMGDSTNGVNSIYRQLLANLTAYGSGPILLRIGGDSTDSRGEPTATTLQPFAEVAKALNAKFTLGVNLGSHDLNLAVDQATAYIKQMPAGSVQAIEIGNEPDLYANNGIRSSTYTFQEYLGEYSTWKQGIVPVLPVGTKLMGPAWSALPFQAAWAWKGMPANLQTFASSEATQLSIFSEHYYVTSPADNPADDFLLTPGAATQGPQAVATAVTALHAQGVPFRMGEMNSASDLGVQGMSDVFAAALWSVDTMFEYANVGVDGVNWEASDGNFDNPFYFASARSGGVTTYTLTSLNPLYYGLLFFQEATGNGARILPVNLSSQANLKAWALFDASGTLRLAIINKDETLAGTISVTLPGFNHASVQRLTAPSYKSTAGIMFADQTLDGTKDGKLQGTLTTETFDGSGGVFQLPMSITSAALVTFTK
jgi:hypothetical protein